MDKQKKEYETRLEREKNIYESKLKMLKVTQLLCDSLKETNNKYKDENITLREENEQMFTTLKQYYHIHFFYADEECSKCRVNKFEAGKLRSKFDSI